MLNVRKEKLVKIRKDKFKVRKGQYVKMRKEC